VQRLHQDKTLQEIAELIKNHLPHIDALKEYQSWVCREEQFDKVQHDAEISEIERAWPSYKTRADNKLCVLPAFFSFGFVSRPLESQEVHSISASQRYCTRYCVARACFVRNCGLGSRRVCFGGSQSECVPGRGHVEKALL
jgi:hypothetical protein